ncbi:MAG: alpha/beta fold hydrolase [Anaerolineales bacterium]|nr:alpha/beta fold hydrolase [Anaerolineales bacterium]
MIVKNAEPFYFPGNSTGCLLIHGFTGAPTEMRPLGEFLADNGFSVLGVRLSGHGTKMADLTRSHWQDWSASVLDGWNLLQSTTDKIILIGLSMGGALALYHASFLPVQGVVSLSAPYRIDPDPRLVVLPLLSHFIPYVSKGESDWQDPDAVEEHFSYDKYPTKAILQLNKLLGKLQQSLGKVTAPALLIHSKKDLGVNPENMTLIYQGLGTNEADKKMVWLENSGHVVTRDLEKMTVFNEVLSFAKDIQGSNQ